MNIPFSPNTSDGAYANAVEALARGVPAAKREARRRGYDQLATGFNYAYRYGAGDADFWRAVGAAGGKRLRRATDWVGVDAYPGTFVPATVADPGDALLEAVAMVRECYMPLAGLGERVPIHLEELGWPTGPGRSEEGQVAALQSFVRTMHRYRGTYGITALNWFGLRDNNSQRTQLPVVLRAAARRLQPQARVRRLPRPDRRARLGSGCPDSVGATAASAPRTA